MKKFMWMVACALLLMAVPMVQSCSDDDDEQEEKEFVIPTAPEDILEYIQGDWEVEERQGAPLHESRRVMRVKDDTLMLYMIEDKTNKTDYAEYLLLQNRDGKLVYDYYSVIDDAPRAGAIMEHVITVNELGKMVVTLKDKVVTTSHRTDFTLPPYSLSCAKQMLEGSWKATKSVKANGELISNYPDREGFDYEILVMDYPDDKGHDGFLAKTKNNGTHGDVEYFSLKMNGDEIIWAGDVAGNCTLKFLGWNSFMMTDPAKNRHYFEFKRHYMPI